MSVLRTEIERALEEIKSNEGGMRFQGLAVILAKLRYPGFVACERKKDFGADALIRASVSTDGIGRAMASSITPALDKIVKDATEIRKAYDDISFLIFVTSEKVGSTYVREWTKKIKDSHGYDLTVISREDIITTLMMPENLGLCRSCLGIAIPYEPSISEASEHIAEALREDLGKWSLRLSGKPLINLMMSKRDSAEKDADHLLSISDLVALLSTGQRVVLEASAGCGKTTQIIRVASEQSEFCMFFLIDLPAWLSSKQHIFEYMASLSPFRSRSITVDQLAKVYNEKQYIFLLNGWNEIDQINNAYATSKLRELEREFPKAGILVATRTHYLKPPLPGAVLTRLKEITNSQRQKYLQERLSEQSRILQEKIENEPSLNELTRNPMILAEVATIFEAGRTIPITRLAILDTILALAEQSDEHRNYLEASPLFGLSRDYLKGLARPMIESGGTSLEDESARAFITAVSRDLNARGQISAIPEAVNVLGSLTSHHLLERSENPNITYRFQHQQFQEFFGAQIICKDLAKLEEANLSLCFEFTKQYLNLPAWDESLLMLAEQIGLNQPSVLMPDPMKAGKLLILMVLNVDPVFAAHLSRLCGHEVWQLVKSKVSERLRLFYADSSSYRKKCAIKAIFATGFSDFSDIVIPILSENNQLQLGVYRSIDFFKPSMLGSDWGKVIGSWSIEAQITLITETLNRSNSSDLLSFVLAQSDLEIKKATIVRLWWIGMNDEASQMFLTLPDAAATELILRYAPEIVSEQIKSRAIDLLAKYISSQSDRIKKLRALLNLSKLSEEDLTDSIKNVMSSVQLPSQHQLDFLLDEVVAFLEERDSEWISTWIADQISQGRLWYEHWHSRVKSISNDLKEKLLTQLGHEELAYSNHRICGLLARDSDNALIQRAMERLCEIKKQANEENRKFTGREGAICRQLLSYLGELSTENLIKALNPNLEREIDFLFLTILSEVLRLDGVNFTNIELALTEECKDKLRSYYRKGLQFILEQQDYFGEYKANFSNALGRFGNLEDVTVVEAVIRADMERVRIGREAYAQGDRTDLGHGSIYGHSHVYIRALTQLQRFNYDTLLSELFENTWYERDVVAFMVSQMDVRKVKKGLGDFLDYKRIQKIRDGKVLSKLDENCRKNFSIQLSNKISSLLLERDLSSRPTSFDSRLNNLSSALACLDSYNSLELILKVVSLLNTEGDKNVVNIIENIVFSGVILSADRLHALLRPYFDKAKSTYQHDQSETYILKRALCLYFFVEQPPAGILILEELLGEFGLPYYNLKTIIVAAGESGTSEAANFICKYANDPSVGGFLRNEIINGLIINNSPEARKYILSLIDCDVEPAIPYNIIHEQDIHTISHLASIANQDIEVRNRLFQSCQTDFQPDRRLLIAAVLRGMQTIESAKASLSLLGDHYSPQIPFSTLRQFEEVFLERKSIFSNSEAYTLEPRRAEELRSTVFDMCRNDPNRRNAANYLLEKIEEGRLDYGRPVNEVKHPDIESNSQWP